jgi:D-lactate dehydrogenase
MKIVVFEAEAWESQAFKRFEDEHEVIFDERRLTAETAKDHPGAQILSVFIYSDLSRKALERLKDLRFIATRSTGYDHVDMDYCREAGIRVANVPSYGENTVAEHAFAMILAISHNLIEAAERTRRGDFSQRGLTGFDLWGRTLGVVGAGDIGAHAARIGKGFGMEVLAYDVAPREDLAGEIGFEYAALDDLLARSDVVTLHVPGTSETEKMIGKPQFERMKDGAVLINTARGSVVDTEAMLQALASGKLRAAGLDVLPEEPVVREEAELLRSYFEKAHDLDMLLADHILLRMRNVIITPHSAFNTRDAVGRILDTTADNISAWLEGEGENLVD